MMVRVAGVEPALLSELDFESSAIPAVATRSVVEIEKQRLPERAIWSQMDALNAAGFGHEGVVSENGK